MRLCPWHGIPAAQVFLRQRSVSIWIVLGTHTTTERREFPHGQTTALERMNLTMRRTGVGLSKRSMERTSSVIALMPVNILSVSAQIPVNGLPTDLELKSDIPSNLTKILDPKSCLPLDRLRCIIRHGRRMAIDCRICEDSV